MIRKMPWRKQAEARLSYLEAILGIASAESNPAIGTVQRGMVLPENANLSADTLLDEYLNGEGGGETSTCLREGVLA